MTLTLVLMNIREEIIQFLDTDLVDIEETIQKEGLRTLKLEYIFQNFKEDKELFKIGNKLWLQGDKHLKDCLYVINTEVTENIYDENKFTVELEEVLVELNYAPLFHQNELNTKDNQNRYLFKRGTTNGQQWVQVNWNAINYWFGDYYNIGVVQDCSSTYAGRINLNGTMTLMNLLRYIEKETGNIFVTRYEKDVLNNQIHRYLDFLNPNNINKNWTLQLEYDFADLEIIKQPEENSAEVTPFDDDDQPIPWTYDPSDPIDDTVWYKESVDYTPTTNLNPDDVVFQVANKDGEVLNANGGVFQDDGDVPILWTNDTIGFHGDVENIVFIVTRRGKNIGLSVNGKSFAVVPASTYTSYPKSAVPEINEGTVTPSYISDDDEQRLQVAIPDDSYFELYDTALDTVVFRTRINNQIGQAHEQVLDFTYNMESVEYNIDETETFVSMSPVLSLGEKDASNSLNYKDMGNLINDWLNLSITKGDTIPMKIVKDNVQANGISEDCDTQYAGVLINKVKCKLGNFDKTNSPNRSTNISGNYWSRPLKPADKIDSETPAKSTFEFWRATSYWRAPFTKLKGEMEIITDTTANTQYRKIQKRLDRRRMRGNSQLHKNGTVSTSEEDPYSIYVAVAEALQKKQTPKFNIKVDVANLSSDGTYNNYDIHDKVYLKLPDNAEIVTARVVKTTKNARDLSKNTIELDNYSINNVKNIQHNTYITAPNYSFRYPSKDTLVARLINEDYNSQDPDTGVNYPSNRLIKIVVYKISQGSRSAIKKIYTKLTDSNGYIKLPLKLKPGNYIYDINFGGDEEYLESTHSVRINVSGQLETKELKEKAKVTFKKKTTKKKNTTTEKTYWKKCGQSPTTKKKEKSKEIVAVAKPSAGAGNYSYTWWKTVFKNKCPRCGGVGTLVYDSGTSKTKCVYCGPYHGSKREWGDISEGEITCVNGDCCCDFDGVTGWEKDGGFSSRLTTIKKPVRSSIQERNKLLNGKLEYGTKEVVKKQGVNGNGTRKQICSSIPKAIVQKALAIVGNKTGQDAAFAICKFMGQRVHYKGYSGFDYSSTWVLNNKLGNCCDQTRLMLQLMDAAGLSEFYDMYYVHVSTYDSGHVFAKLVTRKSGSWRYVDPCKYNPWNNYVTGYGSPPGSQYKVTSNNLLHGIF